MKKIKIHAVNNPAVPKLKAAKKKPVIKAINTKPEDWVDKEVVMRSFRFSLRTMRYYQAKRIIPFAKFDKRVFYYMPGILQILEQNLQY